ncbi:MAG: hypothetical protein JNK76_08085 [Planctomycetales bacterium]|nr:hypothetical protein [Planctomycetales bacterium]
MAEPAKSKAATSLSAPCGERDGVPPIQPCDEEQCSFLAAKIVTAAEAVGDELSTAWSSGALLDFQGSSSTTWSSATPFDDRPPALRSHLALHVLLI